MADTEKKVARLTSARTPFARMAMMIAMAQAAAMAPQGTIAVNAKTLETLPPAPPPPKTQRLRMIDDAGLEYLNTQKAKRRAINARRAENYRRGIEGQRR